MRITVVFLSLLVALAACGGDETPAPAPDATSGNLAVTCGRVIDGLGDDVARTLGSTA